MKRLFRTIILLVIRLLGVSGALSTAQATHTVPAAPRILVVRPDHLGDLIMTTPIIHALKQHVPEANLSVMVGPWSRDVIEHHSAIDCILTCPFPGFQRAAQKALTMSKSVRIMLTGSKRERPILEDIARNMQSPVVLVTDATLGQLAALQAKALMVLSVDSGPLHLAVSQGTPTLQLFGPTDPRIFGPWEKKSSIWCLHQCIAVLHVRIFLVDDWIFLHRK